MPDKLQYLKKCRHKLDGPSKGGAGQASSGSQADSRRESSNVADSNCSSAFRIDSEKESFLDVFSCRRNLEKNQSKGGFDPMRYFSRDIENQIRKVMQTVEKVEQERNVDGGRHNARTVSVR